LENEFINSGKNLGSRVLSTRLMNVIDKSPSQVATKYLSV